MPTWRIPTMRTVEKHTVPVVVGVAPCCGKRDVNADMLRYLGSIPHDLKTLAGFALDQQYACDGCMETVWREGRVGHCEWHIALGAPQDVIDAEIKFMESFPVRVGSRAHGLKLKHHPHLRPHE